MQSVDFLKQALKIQEERGAEYDVTSPIKKERSFNKVAIAFNAITGKDLTAAEIALMLQLLKDVRQWSADRYHKDSVEDCISYSSLKAEELFLQYHGDKNGPEK